MSEDPKDKKVTLTIRATDYASANLNARIAEFEKRNIYIELDPLVKSIQFLRGVAGRASFVLTALYSLWGAQVSVVDKTLPYWRRVQAAQVENASLMTLTLACRAIFDDSRTGMTGKNFAKIPQPTLQSLAEFYAKDSGQPVGDALKAVTLLRNLFKRCAHPSKHLVTAPSLLERRIGLVKRHADAQAAHISLDTFYFHTLDLVHVVAVMTLIGSIITDFDGKTHSERYFDDIDAAAWEAATTTFPGLSGRRLFHDFNIHGQARAYWKIEGLDGLHMLLDQLPAAIGYWDSTNEVSPT